MKRRSFAAWLANLGIALQALWPLISQARPEVPGHLVPLCTVDGVTHYLELPGGKPPGEERSATYHEHCKLCVFGVERLGALPPAALPPLIAPGPVSVAPSAPAPSFSFHFDSPADARAPPVS